MTMEVLGLDLRTLRALVYTFPKSLSSLVNKSMFGKNDVLFPHAGRCPRLIITDPSKERLTKNLPPLARRQSSVK